MRSVNILNKYGFLSDEDRKEPLEHGCEYVSFKTNLELSIPIQVTAYGISKEISIERYSRDLMSFMVFWDYFVKKDLNGFSGFHNVKFEFNGFIVK